MKTLVKRTPSEIAAAIIAVCVSAVVLGATLGLATVMQGFTARHIPPAPSPPRIVATGLPVEEGRRLYLMNCAHCHAPDATGDEGPDLHGVKKNDARITSIIQNGIKGEMPRFGSKFKDADVQALVAFIHSLKK
jgi:mono/diheme cytochrome c family protein